MTRRSRISLSFRSRWPWAAAAGALAIAAGVVVALRPGAAPADAPPALPPLPAPLAARPGGDVVIHGRVIDLRPKRPIGGVQVVFRGATGDATATTQPDGSYALRIAPGSYRAFVRGGGVIGVAVNERPRVPDPPPAEIAGLPDEARLISVVAAHDLDGVDFMVMREGVMAGRVVDPAGQPIGGAVVYATGAFRPVLATDVAMTSDDGSFELRLPFGPFDLAASHPRFAGIAGGIRTRYAMTPGDHLTATLTLAPGCIISGRVIGPDGEPAGDGAIELQRGPGEAAFVPAGRIGPDGAFRWTTVVEDEVALRAWPWKSPPSAVQRFHCRDGARFDGVEFALPAQAPDLEGVLVDRAGRPVRFTFLDVRALDPDGISQQERTDEEGRWEVHDLSPGRYRITARAAGGVVGTTVIAPHEPLRLELGGTGRLEGTTPRMARGSFVLAMNSCIVDGDHLWLGAESRRLVAVTGGRFAIDDLPACELDFAALWSGSKIDQHVEIPAGGTAQIELPVGELRDKTVRGVVRTAAGEPVAGVAVTAVRPDRDPDASARNAVTMTDAAGRYTIQTVSGATLRVSAHGEVGEAQVGGANIDAEQVDLVIGEPAADDAPAR